MLYREEVGNVEDLRKKFEVMEEKVSGLEMRIALAEKDIRATIEKLDKIDANTTWILRLIVSAIVVSLLGLVITSGGTL